MLMRTDPFRELDRLSRQVFGPPGTAARPSVMPMDAWRDHDSFVIAFDLPGIDADSIDIDVERNVLSVRANRPAAQRDNELVAAERPRGVFSRQVVLGDMLDTDAVTADYRDGVLTVRLPISERAKPRKIAVHRDSADRASRADTADSSDSSDRAELAGAGV